MRRIAVAMALAMVGCGGGGQPAAAPVTTQAAPTSLATTTTAAKTVRQWAAPSLPYVQPMQAAFDEVGAGARSVNLDQMRLGAQHLSDAARGFRLSLETAGSVPPGAAVQGPAVIEATRDLEQKSRAVAGCVATSDCLAAVSAENVAFSSWGTAVAALTKVLGS